MISNYNILIERCKREDTKPLMIKCLDKAAIDYKNQEMQEFADAIKIVGFAGLIVIIGICVIAKIFK